MATIGIVVLLSGVTIDAIWLGIVGFIIMGGGIFLATKRTTRPPSKSGGRGGSGQQSKSNPGLMEGLESRWDERRRQQEASSHPWHLPFTRRAAADAAGVPLPSEVIP